MRFVLLLLPALLTAAEFTLPDPAVELERTAAGVRLKDLVDIKGVRDNQLHGIGIVVGLDGQGDKNGGTVRMLRNFLASKNLQFTEADLTSKNVAMVAVTADFPVFSKEGSRLATQVSSIGDAKTLKGGILLETRLVAADGKIYAVAQGPLTVVDDGDAHETVAALAEGATVEREVPARLLYGDKLVLTLRQPDFSTAHKVAQELAEVFDPELVSAKDASQITLGFAETPDDAMLVQTIAKLEGLRVLPDMPARVVIDTKTGTVVVGNNVHISKAAVSRAGLSIRVLPQERRTIDPKNPDVIQRQTVWVDPVTGIDSEKPPAGLVQTPNHGNVSVMSGATVEDIANALNAMGATPRDMVAIFQGLEQAGALHAELVVR